MLSRGDKVRVTGIFRHLRSVQGLNKVANEVDSTRGDIEVLQGRRYDARERRAESDAADAVPTTVVDTPWSISVAIASLLSAVFAAVAAIPLLLYPRRFNVKLEFTELEPREMTPLENGLSALVLTLRLISTKSLTPQVADGAVLHLGEKSFLSNSIRIPPFDKAPDFPLAVKDDLVVRLSYIIPSDLTEAVRNGYIVVLQDKYCRRNTSIKALAVPNWLSPPIRDRLSRGQLVPLAQRLRDLRRNLLKQARREARQRSNLGEKRFNWLADPDASLGVDSWLHFTKDVYPFYE